MEHSIIKEEKSSRLLKNQKSTAKTVGSFHVYAKDDLNKLRAEFYALELKVNNGEVSEEEKRRHTSLCNILTSNGVKLNPVKNG